VNDTVNLGVSMKKGGNFPKLVRYLVDVFKFELKDLVLDWLLMAYSPEYSDKIYVKVRDFSQNFLGLVDPSRHLFI